jgi:hypothetical protein
MKTIKLNNLFESARRETAPAVDVADSVLTMLAIGRQIPSASLNRSLMWISMASSAVAAGIVLAAFLTWQHSAGSVNEIINVVAWVAQ